MGSRVLIAAWYRWPTAVRMASALIAGGVAVDVVCPDLHPILSLKGLSQRFRFAVASPTNSLARAIEGSKPAIIIPCDNFVLGALNHLRKRGAPSTAAVIERSIGGTGVYETLTSRASLIEAAQEAGVLCPPTRGTPSREALSRWLDEYGAPAFVKLDGTFGGRGVRLARDAQTAIAAFDELAKRPSAAEVLKHFLKRQELSKASAWLGRTPMTVSVQKSVPGVPANCSVFAWDGEVRAIVSVEVLQTATEFGVATRVRPIESAAMDAAARAIARRFRLTGVFGLDFMLDTETDRTWLIELNLRPTQISHMAFGQGRDLITAIHGAIAKGPAPSRPDLPTGASIALFPHCLWSGVGNGEDFQDLPYDQPDLIRAFLPLRERLARLLKLEPPHRTSQAPMARAPRILEAGAPPQP